MKKLILILTSLFVVSAATFFCACGDNASTAPPPADTTQPDEPGTTAPETPALLSFTGITFSDKTVVYNGSEQVIEISGTLPEGTSIVYKDNRGTDAGVYNASVKLTKDGYNPLTLTAKLTINKAEYASANITLPNKTVEYDTFEHSLQVVGNLPLNAQVTYKYNGVVAQSVSQVGVYTVECTIESPNYLTITLTAKLTITSTEELLYSAYSNGSMYFQNNLDGNKLYVVSGATVKKVNNDTPAYMITDGTNLFYYSTSLFSKVIKQYSSGTSSTVYSVSGEYLVTDGTYVYYAINNLVVNTSKNGIYRFKIGDDTQTEPVRLTADKAEYPVYNGGYIYYSNMSDGGKLYRISATANESTGTKLWDEKVSDIINDGGTLYFNSTNGLAKAIYKYTVSSSSAVKLTTDAGKYLTKIGNYIYYVNNDLLTSNIFGDGIYRVSTAKTSDSSLPGEKIISAEDNGYSSLSTDGVNLYFYKLNDKHFYKFNVSTEQETDLMSGFVPVEEVSVSGYSCLAEYEGEIYYTNPLEDGCLYKYSTTTGNTFKVLADSVSNVYFNKGYMYYSTYVLTNYALFRMDMATGESIKISSSRCENLIFDGDTIYYVKIGVGGTHTNYIMKMNMDGGNVTELYTKTNLNVTGFEKVGNVIYFITNPAIGYKTVNSFDLNDGQASSLSVRAQDLVVCNNKIYYYAHTENAFKCCHLDGSGATVIKANVEINDMYVDENTVYFSSASKENTGFYSYDTVNGQTVTISDKQANGITVYGGKVYFLQSEVSYVVDYPSQNSALDCKLYCFNGTTVTKVA